MKKIILVCGLISGLIVSAVMIYSTASCYNSNDFEGNMFLGYASMIIAYSLIFVGVKTFRDKYHGGKISFGKAFRIGLWITLIAATIYVVVWLIDFYFFIPDFMERYAAHMLNQAKNAGATAAELAQKAAEMNSYREMYKKPLFVILLTYAEIIPVGLVVSLIAALILRKKTNPGKEQNRP